MTICQKLSKSYFPSEKKRLKEMTKDKTQSRFSFKITNKLQNHFKKKKVTKRQFLIENACDQRDMKESNIYLPALRIEFTNFFVAPELISDLVLGSCNEACRFYCLTNGLYKDFSLHRSVP